MIAPAAPQSPTLARRFRNFFTRGPAITSEPAVVASWPTPVSFFPSGDEGVQAHAGARNDRSRSWLPAFVQGANQDITPGDRIELVRKARYFEQWNDMVQKALDLIETNVVGTGINPTPASDDPTWNAAALEWWNGWCQYADAQTRQHFYTLQSLCARAQAVDGEIFVWLTRSEDGSRPRLRLIESHRVRSASNVMSRYQDANGIRLDAKDANNVPYYTEFDGIVFDQRGRPAFYLVSNDADAFSTNQPRSVAVIPAIEIVHIFEPSRAGQARGIPLFSSVLHDIHDLDDLQQYEMLASKKATEQADIITTANGELPQDGTVIGRSKRVTKDDGTEDTRVAWYKRGWGASTKVLKSGDTWQQSGALRPTAAQQEFWVILQKKFCRGTGISYAAMTDYEGGWGGAALRAAITSDNRFYDVRTKSLVTAMQRIWEYVMPFAAKDIPGKVPATWKKVRWQPPRRSTVDVGRESKAILEEMAAGMRTERDTQGELGLDWVEVGEQRAKEIEAKIPRAERIANAVGCTVLDALAMLGVNVLKPASQPAPVQEAGPDGTPNGGNTNPNAKPAR